MPTTVINAKLPISILAKHPALETISIALEQYRGGSPITAKCIVCGANLKVTDIPEIGKLWVTCDTGCTDFRESYS